MLVLQTSAVIYCFFVLSALTGGVKVPMKSKYVLVFFSRIAPMSHLYTSMGPRVAKTFFLGIFEVISVFVSSWKIIKRLMTYPALRGVHYLSYSKGFLYLERCHGCMKRRTVCCSEPNLTDYCTEHNFTFLFTDLGETGTLLFHSKGFKWLNIRGLLLWRFYRKCLLNHRNFFNDTAGRKSIYSCSSDHMPSQAEPCVLRSPISLGEWDL